MKANYGFKDGSGEYYITIDTDLCIDCEPRSCVTACPVGIFQIIEDDYDDEVAAVVAEHRNKIKFSCAPCKPVTDRPPLPCVGACPNEAIIHSW